MKKQALFLAVVAALSLQACNEQTSTPETETETLETAAATVALDTPEQRLSYGMAYNLGQRLAADPSMTLDVTAFTAGLEDALNGAEAKLTQEQIAQEMELFQQQAIAQQQAEQAAIGEANIAEGAAFLAENATKEGVVVTESGLQYIVEVEGEGATPTVDDTVEVHYRGTLLDGTEFDSSYARGQTVSFGVTQVIAGWTEALQLMKVGSKWKVFIPSDLAYGPGGAGGTIGPNATLVFDIELIGIEGQE